MPNARNTLLSAASRAMRPRKRLSVSEWADAHRVLTSKSSPEPGRWRTGRMPHLKEPMDALSVHSAVDKVVCMFPVQMGKALALDTPIATDSGWSTMGDVEVGDVIFAANGNPAAINYCSPVFYDHDCFEVVFADGERFIADAGHQWYVEGYKAFGSISDRFDSGVYRGVLTTQEIAEHVIYGNQANFSVPLCKPLALKKTKLPIAPYLLGMWLSDGSGATGQITSHEDDADEIGAYISADTTFPVEVRSPKWIKGRCKNILVGSRKLTNQTFHGVLKTENLLDHKHVPSCYLRACMADRLRLIQGLMDGDGTIGKDGRPSFSTSNTLLRDAMMELLLSMGLKPHCAIKEICAHNNFKPRSTAYVIGFTAYKGNNVFRLKRKKNKLKSSHGRRPTQTMRRTIVRVNPVESCPVRCIQIDDPAHLFLAGTSMIPTHNTEIGLNWQGYIIDHAPSPTLSVQPTLELRDRYVAQRVNDLLETTECLAEKFNSKARRSASNSKDVKDFAGGILVLGGGNSPASLSSMPIKNVIVDELDRFPWTLRGEGDPLGLIEGRQSNFSRRKSLYISSPTMKDSSRIEEEFLAGDQRYRQVPCPHCGAWIELVWKQLQWSRINGVLKEVWYVCEHCGSEIEEHHKPQMLCNENARWMPHNKGASFRSYTINALYSPIGIGWSWMKLVEEWLKVQGDLAKLKRFINTRLAESWEAKRKFKPQILKERAEDYALRSVPVGCLLLTCGVDTQDDRLAIQLIGHGKNRVVWVLDYFEIPGNIVDLIDEFIRKEGKLYEYLSTPLVNAFGKHLRIRATAWDTGGHYTDDVYRAVRSKVVPLLMAVKGLSVSGKPILSARPSKQDVNKRGKVIRGGVELWGIGTDTAKDLIFSTLEADEDKAVHEQRLRFSAELDEDYFKMLLAENFDPEKNKYVKKSGARNESLDTLAYAIAASRNPKLRVHVMKAADWDRLQVMLEPKDVVVDAEVVQADDVEPALIGGISLSGWGRG